MNKVILMGRLTRDPEISMAGETKVAHYSLAVDRKRRANNGEENADFIRCVEFGKFAEFAEKYLRQGTKIVICGRIQTGSYTNKNGQKVYTTEVVVEEHDFAESRKTPENNQGYQQAPLAGAPNGYQNQPAGMPNGYQNQPAGMPNGYQNQPAGMPNGYQNQPAGTYPSSMPNSDDGFMNIPDGLDEDLPFN